MKIAIFTDTFIPEVNGVARTLKRFTDYLEENKIEYRVFAPKSSNKNIFTTHVHSITSFPFFLYPECRVALPNLLQLRDEIQRFNPDIIHVATPFNMGLSGLHLAKKLAIPVVGSYHTDFDKYLTYYELHFLSEMLWKYMRWFHHPFRKVFVPSSDTLNRLKSRGFSNLSIWPRGIDRTIFHPHYDEQTVRNVYQIEEKYILTYVGRIAMEKDVLLLPEIANMLPNNIKNDVHWLIVGDGPLKKDLGKMAPPNMTLTGFVEGINLANIYAASDVFVFPSPSETFGNVVLESLACGTPVIGANAGGVKTIIQNGITGILCTEKDITEFVHAITSLLGREQTRKIMGENGKIHAQAQSWDTIFNNLLLEYEEALEIESFQELA
ncbi:glycosyltransferase family 4 protein [Pseudogracilibacillus auburnensis]|uniref:Glycosyltransferase involved in cell wall biosynthesis n=1 Tax=Pseudogracilibacillus auburnensis TaxID=1494959 RepID=A0A2V3W7G8_9BACI|nr:glycosyltransferase family 1 protein [Pseudogracilibacillus auburnensis]PXW90267.1 glycosyltransferase involved in cell wall biosynthesis [Pseudogracilibacillus auburnensis]